MAQEKYRRCPRCGKLLEPVLNDDGMIIGWYCANCKAAIVFMVNNNG